MSIQRLTEKYRPHKWEDVVGQEDVIKRIRGAVERAKLQGPDGITPHFLFVGAPGTGKTTVAEIVANTLGYYKHEYNASDDRTLTFVREEIKKIAQFSGARIIILDEADMMRPDAQMALKRMMETTSAIFILLVNHEWKIDDAIKSRCAKFTFNKIKDEIIEARIVTILLAEGVKIQPSDGVKQGLHRLVKNADGDLRQAINDLETIIDTNGWVTDESISALQGKSGLGVIALTYALQGNFETAKEAVEKAHVEGKYNPKSTIQELYQAIPQLQIDPELKIRMFEKLGQTDANLKFGGDPIVQILSFIAFVWLLPHLSKCPVLNKVN